MKANDGLMCPLEDMAPSVRFHSNFRFEIAEISFGLEFHSVACAAVLSQ